MKKVAGKITFLEISKLIIDFLAMLLILLMLICPWWISVTGNFDYHSRRIGMKLSLPTYVLLSDILPFLFSFLWIAVRYMENFEFRHPDIYGLRVPIIFIVLFIFDLLPVILGKYFL